MEKQEAIEKYKKLLKEATLDNMPKVSNRVSFQLSRAYDPVQSGVSGVWSFRIEQIKRIDRIEYSLEFDFNNKIGQLTWNLDKQEYDELLETSQSCYNKLLFKFNEDTVKRAISALRKL